MRLTRRGRYIKYALIVLAILLAWAYLNWLSLPEECRDYDTMPTYCESIVFS